MLDGIENTDPNFMTYLVLPSVDAIQEFNVETGTYSAEFGHNMTQMNVVTKSGTNQYHGVLVRVPAQHGIWTPRITSSSPILRSRS